MAMRNKRLPYQLYLVKYYNSLEQEKPIAE